MKIVRLFLEHGAVANIAAGDINLFIKLFLNYRNISEAANTFCDIQSIYQRPSKSFYSLEVHRFLK
jgi:hypothetical protein